MALRLNYLDENGDLRFRPLRNCDLITKADPREAAAHAKWAFNKDCPSAQTNGRNYWRQMVDWLLSPVRDGYAPKTEGGEE